MRSVRQKALRFFFALSSFSMIMLFAGEWQAAGALWVVILCLLPAICVALRTSYLSLKMFCAITLITQVITVPMFYLQADRYAFSEHRPFGFTALDASPVFLIIGLFLWLVAYLVKLSEGVIGRSTQWTSTNAPTEATRHAGVLALGSAKRQAPLIVGILLLMAISLPAKFWMFDMGIGIVGVDPPYLPFRLSGILTYLFGMVVPLTIAYLYLRTKRSSLLLVSLISVYALLIGLSSSSKSVVLFATAPIVAFAWLDRRWAIFTVSGIMAGFGVLIAATSRAIVHMSDGLTTGAFTDLGTIGTLLKTLLMLEWSPEMLLVFAGIAARIEGFQGLFLASQFNADAVGGAFEIFMHAINANWATLEHDALHLEFLGYIIPMGFYSAGASINSWMLMATNHNLFMVLPFAIYVASTLVILEKLLMRASHKYKLPLPLTQAVLFFVTLWFDTATGSQQFLTMFYVVVIFGLLPALRVGHSSRPTCSH